MPADFLDYICQWRKTDAKRLWEEKNPYTELPRQSFAAALVISLTAVSMNTQFFYQLAYESEGIVSRSLRQISGQAQTPVMHGRVSSGNNYRTHAVQMTLETDVQPTENIIFDRIYRR